MREIVRASTRTVLHLRLTAMSVRGPAGRRGIASRGHGFTAVVRPGSLRRLAQSSASGAMVKYEQTAHG